MTPFDPLTPEESAALQDAAGAICRAQMHDGCRSEEEQREHRLAMQPARDALFDLIGVSVMLRGRPFLTSTGEGRARQSLAAIRALQATDNPPQALIALEPFLTRLQHALNPTLEKEDDHA